jgi:hypothetical protein
MPVSPEGWVVAVVGALIVVAHTAIAGRRIELLLPNVVPCDLGAAMGIAAGLAIVATWLF